MFLKDGAQLYIDRADLQHLKTIDNMYHDLKLGNTPAPALKIPISLSADLLQMILSYCRDPSNRKDNSVRVFLELETFFPDLKKEQLMQLVEAANYLDVPTLFDLGIQKIATDIKGKSTEEMRDYFNVIGDFTEDEEKEVRASKELFIGGDAH